MKKKALRRWQQRVARVRARRFLYEHFSSEHVRQRPWRAWNQIGAYLRNDSGAWLHVYVTRPARAQSNRRLHDIERGVDPDVICDWPNYREPHVYQW